MDILFLRDFRLETIIGLYEWERKAPQPVMLDIEIGLYDHKAGHTDDVADTIDYEQVALGIRKLAASGHFKLVETFADRIARLIVDDFKAPWVKVSAAKIGILPNAKFVGVSIERKR